MNQTELLVSWNQAKEQLDHWKKVESELRELVVSEFYPSHVDEGTVNYELADNYVLKAQFKLDYKLTATPQEIEDVVTELSTYGEDGEDAIEGLFKVTTDLVPKKFKSLAPSFKHIVEKLVTIRPAKPSLSITQTKK